MDPVPGPDSFTYLKSHPIVLISLIVSLAALTFGLISLSRLLAPESAAVPGLKELPQIDPVANTVAVDIEGQVVHPGLVELPLPQSGEVRVADAIAAVGGFLPTADADYIQRQLNLAAIVQDGAKLYVPKKGESANKTGVPASEPGKVNVNNAPLNQLTELKGIGEARAKILVDNRPYASFDELKTKTKLPASTLEAIKDDLQF